jgi:OOP family OmpA-OmpF porin
LFGFHDASVWRMPAALQAKVETALQLAGQPGLDVTIEGQQARLRGIVADESAIAAAARAALGAVGPGGAWAGGVTSVDASGLSVGPFAQPFAWRITREESRVVLSGSVPSDASRAELMRAAAAAFPNAEAIDEMRVAGGAPAADWTAMARHVIRALSLLTQGDARIRDTHIALVGDGPFEAVRRLRADYAAPRPPFRALVAASVDGLDLEFPELQGVDLRAPSAQACTQAFARVSESHALTFASGAQHFSADSAPALQALASVALRCDRYRLDIRGPGEGGANLSLSRAEAIANQLAALNVRRERMRALAGVGARVVVSAESGSAP